jgi:DNA-binding transcriptional ArsR family regulator
MLDISLRNPDVSLYELFGRTATTSPEARRSPYTRLSILFELDTNPSDLMTISNLAEKLNIGTSNVSEQVKSLEVAGLIDVNRMTGDSYKRTIVGFDQAKLEDYNFSDSEDNFRSLLVDQIRSQSTQSDKPLIVDELIFATQALFPDADPERVRKNLNRAIYDYERVGLIKTNTEFTNEQRSHIRLNPNKRELIDDLMIGVLSIMDGDEEYIAAGILRAEEIAHDKLSVNILLGKARETSPWSNQVPRAQFADTILGYLKSNEYSAAELAKIIAADGKPTSAMRVLNILRGMYADGVVEYSIVGRTHVYRLKNG